MESLPQTNKIIGEVAFDCAELVTQLPTAGLYDGLSANGSDRGAGTHGKE